MHKLLFEAIGKYIHPTRHCQIIEKQILNQRSCSEQREFFSEDQKHSTAVAKKKKYYPKQRLHEVAVKGFRCLQKLRGSKGSEVDGDFHARFGS